MGGDQIERCFLLLDVGEVREPLQVRSQRFGAQAALEFAPAQGLRLFGPSERVENGDPQVGELGGVLRRIGLGRDEGSGDGGDDANIA